MTTITNGNGQSAYAPKSISRREFLFYLGGGSIALAAAGSCGAAYWFTQQRVTYGRISGVYLFEPKDLPILRNAPVLHPESRIYLVLSENGLVALNGACIREQQLFRWIENNNRFECPACGSKYRIDGTYIEGPASRSADRFIMEVRTPDGTRTTPPDGSPVSVENLESFVVDTRTVLRGVVHPTPTPYTF